VTSTPPALAPVTPVYDPSQLVQLPLTYQALTDYLKQFGQVNVFTLRSETFKRIERVTGRPLICYVAKTNNLAPGIPAYLSDDDLTGFGDMASGAEGYAVDVFMASNGGSAEATERIVRMLREKFTSLRFILASNAYSAATMMAFSGDEIIMDSLGTLGPIDPQINGIPARAILRAFEEVEKKLKAEGPSALTAYMPLLNKYDLPMLEICKSAQKLSEELAQQWLSKYLLKRDMEDEKVKSLVAYFANYDEHKSHGRSIGREKARELGLPVTYTENIPGLFDLVRSLRNQYELFLDKTPFFKLFEDARGTSWGRQAQSMTFQIPMPFAIPFPGAPQPAPQPGPPTPTR
jgi:hypothetical protein